MIFTHPDWIDSLGFFQLTFIPAIRLQLLKRKNK